MVVVKINLISLRLRNDGWSLWYEDIDNELWSHIVSHHCTALTQHHRQFMFLERELFCEILQPIQLAYYIRVVSFYLIFEYRCSDATSQLYFACCRPGVLRRKWWDWKHTMNVMFFKQSYYTYVPNGWHHLVYIWELTEGALHCGASVKLQARSTGWTTVRLKI